MFQDHGQQAIEEMKQASSIADLCPMWQSKYRSILVASQGFLRIFYPHGAEAIQVLITLVDGFCGTNVAPGTGQQISSVGPVTVGEVG